MTRFKKPVISLNAFAGLSTSVVAAFILVLPAVTLVTGCSKDIDVKGADSSLVSREVTVGGREAIYPDDDPSVPNGKVVYQKLSCAECHGENGQPVAGKATIDLSNKDYMRKQKPIDQYMFLAFGKDGVKHPATLDKVSTQQTWNLTFYVRNLANPLLSKADYDAVTPVYGANCAVCHGPKGFGDGPLNKYNVLEPNPANFQNFKRFYDRTDDVLWDHIANGIKWEGMPNFLGKEDKAKNVKFDEDYIWKLVSYVRAFHSTDRSTIADATAGTKPKAEDAQPKTGTETK
jgi:mono/diheme cytochrome c family protein